MVELIRWLQENSFNIDWQLFAEPWDAMQRRHNPFRDDQIDTIIHTSAILDKEEPKILDLGCGPGILGRRIVKLKPEAHYYGVDGDPLMLAAMQRLVPGNNVHPLYIDLRSIEWILQYKDQFDAVISLTALHWLSKDHLKQLFSAIHCVLKPSGRLIIGDPYLPSNPLDIKKLKAFQDERGELELGTTWNEFWTAFFEKYPIKDAYTQYHRSLGYQEPFEGSDDGYPLSFYEESLVNAGFRSPTVFWMSGLRIVYGGTKPIPPQ